MNPILTAVLLAAGLGLFGWSVRRRLAPRREGRVDRFGDRAVSRGRFGIGPERGRCQTQRPTHVTGKPQSVKGLNLALKHHLVDEAPAMRGPARGEDTRGPASGALSNLVGEVTSPETQTGRPS